MPQMTPLLLPRTQSYHAASPVQSTTGHQQSGQAAGTRGARKETRSAESGDAVVSRDSETDSDQVSDQIFCCVLDQAINRQSITQAAAVPSLNAAGQLNGLVAAGGNTAPSASTTSGGAQVAVHPGTPSSPVTTAANRLTSELGTGVPAATGPLSDPSISESGPLNGETVSSAPGLTGLSLSHDSEQQRSNTQLGIETGQQSLRQTIPSASDAAETIEHRPSLHPIPVSAGSEVAVGATLNQTNLFAATAVPVQAAPAGSRPVQSAPAGPTDADLTELDAQRVLAAMESLTVTSGFDGEPMNSSEFFAFGRTPVLPSSHFESPTILAAAATTAQIDHGSQQVVPSAPSSSDGGELLLQSETLIRSTAEPAGIGPTISANTAGSSVMTFADIVTAESRQPLSHQVSQAVYEQVQRHGANGPSALTLRLDPPTLGELIIHLSRNQHGVAVRVTAREPITMDMLLARGHEIESQLMNRELDLTGIEFLRPDSSGGEFGQRRSGESQQDPGALTQAKRGGRGGQRGAGTSAVIGQSAGERVSGDGRISVLA